MQYYLTNLYATQIYQTIFCIYLYQKVSNMVPYQPKSSYQVKQDMKYFLAISSPILNYQPKISYQLTQDLNYVLSISSAILNYQPENSSQSTQDMNYFYLLVVQY